MRLMLSFFLAAALYINGSAQITQAEFDKAMQTNAGNNQAASEKMIEGLEKKYPNDGKVIFLRGMYQFRDGNTNMAMMSFTKVIQILPKFTLAYNGRAMLFQQKGLIEKSIADFSKSLEINPTDGEIYGERASLYTQINQHQNALADYEKQVQLSPSNIMGYYNAAITSVTLGNTTAADNYFTKAYSAKGMQAFVVNALYGKFLLLQKRFSESKAKYELALQEGESQFGDEDFNLAAIAFYKNELYDKAIIYTNKAIALQPNNIDYKCNLASIYVDKKDWQKVKDIAQAGLAVNANHAMANMYMAVALTKLGREAEAQPYLIKAKQ